MKQQTIYFLQALWDAGVRRDKLEKLARDAALYEIDHLLEGVLDSRTIWISDTAKELKRQVGKVRQEIGTVSRPYQLTGLNKEYQKLIGEIHGLQVKTVRTLYAEYGPLSDDLHIIVRQLFPFALKKFKEQTCFQLYRLMALRGSLPKNGFYLPQGDFLEEWISFYLNKLEPMFAQLDDRTLDGRWAYERKSVVLNRKIHVEQFVAVKPFPEELKNGIGRPKIGTGEKGHLRIYGRGYITNLTPWDMMGNIGVLSGENLAAIEDCSFIEDENANPVQLLERIFRGKKYIVAPENYFELINRFMTADTFYRRVKLGNCIYCGSPLYHNQCPNCER